MENNTSRDARNRKEKDEPMKDTLRETGVGLQRKLEGKSGEDE